MHEHAHFSTWRAAAHASHGQYLSALPYALPLATALSHQLARPRALVLMDPLRSARASATALMIKTRPPGRLATCKQC